MTKKIKENITIVLLRDKGARKSFNLSFATFNFWIIFFICIPFVCGTLIWLSFKLWQENKELTLKNEQFQQESIIDKSTIARLQTFEQLINEQKKEENSNIVLQQIAKNNEQEKIPAQTNTKPQPEKPVTENQVNATSEQTNDPGHVEFPKEDTGFVKVDNVQARAGRDNKIRLTLDLTNPTPGNQISGNVKATLIAANGNKVELDFVPQDIGSFKINNFKHASMLSTQINNIPLANSQLILVVEDNDKNIVYRNLFSIER